LTVNLHLGLKNLLPLEFPNSSLLDQKKQTALANLGVFVSKLWNDTVSIQKFRRDLVASTWTSRLPELNISAKGNKIVPPDYVLL